MIRVIADERMKARLVELSGPAEIRDADGHVIGYFTPASAREAELYSRAAAALDPEEMKRRKNSGEKGYTTAEVLQHLNSLETS